MTCFVDTGKADMAPNGIDFIPNGGRPTGRFSNGKTVTDLIADELGATGYSPPYLTSDYASGGAKFLTQLALHSLGNMAQGYAFNPQLALKKQNTKNKNPYGFYKRYPTKNILRWTPEKNGILTAKSVHNHTTPPTTSTTPDTFLANRSGYGHARATDPEEAEAITVIRGLEAAQRCGLSRVLLLTDCQ
ncbi:hypothetical protein GIB67_021305, partial [Kingdonia uniflora]